MAEHGALCKVTFVTTTMILVVVLFNGALARPYDLTSKLMVPPPPPPPPHPHFWLKDYGVAILVIGVIIAAIAIGYWIKRYKSSLNRRSRSRALVSPQLLKPHLGFLRRLDSQKIKS